MSSKTKRILSALFIVGSIVAVCFIALSNQELANAWDSFSKMDLRWLCAAFLCWAVFVLSDGMNYWSYLRRQGFQFSLGRAVHVALIGFYYSNLTPSAAGGQPMQVNSLRKAGIPVGYGTMAVTIRFITNETMLSVISLVLFLLNRDYVYAKLGDAMWFVRIGWLINFAAVPLVLLAAFKRNWIQKIAEWLIQGMSRIHLVRNTDATLSNVTAILDTYHTALRDLIHAPGQILVQFACSTVSLLTYFGIIIFVYYAFGQSGTPWYHVLTLSAMVYLTACYTPLPGSSGAQEGGFLVYFKGVFSEKTIGLALLVWRFFTFYLFLIVGVFMVLLEKNLVSRQNKMKAQQDGPPEIETASNQQE